MTAKQFLRQVRTIDRRIERDAEQLMRLRAKVEAGRSPVLTGMPRGGDSDWTDTVDRLITLQARYRERIRRACALKQAAMDAIERVEDARLRDVLELYYLCGFTWEQVAEEMGYKDVRWVYRLHGRALNAVKLGDEAKKDAPDH